MYELQAWITACRTFLKTNMGSYLLRTGRDESLLVGDLHLTLKELQDLDQSAGRHFAGLDGGLNHYMVLENCGNCYLHFTEEG
jgi:breakpoint cluster region protein